MAFKLFKKKEPEYPSDEKAEILEPNFPSVPELPPLSEETPTEETQPQESFSFRSPEELRPPPVRPREMGEMMSPSMRPPSLPSFARPEPLSRPEPMEGVFPSLRAAPRTAVPHVYVRITKYKEVMDSINELGKRIQQTKDDIEEIHAIGEQESDKIRDAAEVILKIEELLKYLQDTFTAPEE